MAETMVTDPVYLDQTAKDNGKKLDQMTAALLGMSSSLGVIARAQTGVVEEMDYNGIKAVVAAGNAPAVFPVGTQLVNTYTAKDGKEYELEVLTTVEYNGASYLAVVPADADEGEGLEVSILRSTDEDGEPLLCAIEDEAELQAVYDLIMDSLYEEETE